MNDESEAREAPTPREERDSKPNKPERDRICCLLCIRVPPSGDIIDWRYDPAVDRFADYEIDTNWVERHDESNDMPYWVCAEHLAAQIAFILEEDPGLTLRIRLMGEIWPSVKGRLSTILEFFEGQPRPFGPQRLLRALDPSLTRTMDEELSTGR
jgi:hypothetical protein